MIRVDVITSGPYFDGGMKRSVNLAVDEASEKVAQTGVNMVKSRLDTVLVNPTGRYQSQIQTDRSTTSPVVTDSGSVYGPWLEGVSSRNASSRFKGYATFRKTTAKLQTAAAGVADPIIDRRIK